jgi:hypothetical protein
MAAIWAALLGPLVHAARGRSEPSRDWRSPACRRAAQRAAFDSTDIDDGRVVARHGVADGRLGVGDGGQVGERHKDLAKPRREKGLTRQRQPPR